MTCSRLGSRRRGSATDYVKRLRKLAAAASPKFVGLGEISPHLLRLISDERTLFPAWQQMAKAGGRAPGPDGCRYDQFSQPEIWQWCRGMRGQIRNGRYTAGEETVRRIPKSSNRGFRESVLRSIFDHVVHRAVVEVCQVARSNSGDTTVCFRGPAWPHRAGIMLGAIPYAARSDTSLKVWNFRVISDVNSSACWVGTPWSVVSIAARKDAKFA